MSIYIVMLFVFFALQAVLKPNLGQKNKKYFIIIMFGIIYLVNALRSPDIGIDLAKYYAPHYADFARLSWDNLQSVNYSGDWEIGFCAFCKLLTYISTDVQFFIAVSSAVIVLPYAYFIYKNAEDVVFSTFFYISYNLMFSNMNTIRQALAVSIVIMGLGFLRDRKYIKFLLVVVLAITFHKSAFIALILIPANMINFTRVKMAISLLVFGLIPVTYSVLFNYLLNIPFLSESYSIYESGTHSVGYVNVNSLMQFIVPFLLFIGLCIYERPWNIENCDEEDPSARITFKNGVIQYNRNSTSHLEWTNSAVCIGIFLAATCRFYVFFIFVVGRLSQYFIPFAFIAFPRMINQVSDYHTKIIIKYGFYCALLVYFLYIGFTSGSSLYGTVPYEFFW